MSTTTNFYVYAYINNGQIYYIGKGKGRRAWQFHENVTMPTDKQNIIILEDKLTELGAWATERKLIEWYGRINTGTGSLVNKTPGGEGVAGFKWNDESKKNRSGAGNPMYGVPSTNFGEKNGMYGKYGEDNPLYGRKRPDHSKAMVGDNNPMKREDLRKAQSERVSGKNNPRYEKTWTADEKTYLKECIAATAKECPHCAKVVAGGNYSRWHGDNCRSKIEVI